MKVVHVAHNYFPGIGLAAMYEFCLQEAKLGLNVQAIVLGRHKEGILEEDYDGVHLYKIPSVDISARSLKKLEFIRETANILKKLDCDIVHVYSNLGLGILPILVGRSKKKWLYDIRSGPVHPGISRLIGLVGLRVESQLFDLCTASSMGTRDMVFPQNEKRVPVFSMGVNMERFQPMDGREIRKRYHIKPDQILIIFTGTLHPTRKLDQMIRAMLPVRDNSRDNVILMILGDGPDRERLQQLVHTLKLDNNIIMTGSVDFNQVPQYLCAADIGLAYVPNTAEYGPQPALKVAEMLACGLPVAASDTPGNRLLIKDQENGLIFHENDQNFLLKIVDLFFCDRALFEQFTKSARKSIADYDYKIIIKDVILPTYSSLLSL